MSLLVTHSKETKVTVKRWPHKIISLKKEKCYIAIKSGTETAQKMVSK